MKGWVDNFTGTKLLSDSNKEPYSFQEMICHQKDQFGIYFKQVVVSINNSLLSNNGRRMYGSDKGKERGYR
jgi:hypothetical protein